MKYFPKMYNGYCCSTREVIILTVTLSSSFFPRKVLTENLITNPTRFFLIKEIMQPNKKKNNWHESEKNNNPYIFNIFERFIFFSDKKLP